MTNQYEDNPFEDEIVAKEWINSVENESGMIREKELIPMIKNWIEEYKPQIIVDIGMGQGSCADIVQWKDDVEYIGIEPSVFLVDRAVERFSKGNRKFIIGNAYSIPVENNLAEAAFAINVWFHLKDLDKASSELSRILKSGGNFLICTANPDAYNNWRSRFEEDVKEDDESIDGKVYVPINPLSRNLFFKHSMKKMLDCFERNNLIIDKTINNGIFDSLNGPEVHLFVNFFGHKK